jgi:hypothetical protein
VCPAGKRTTGETCCRTRCLRWPADVHHLGRLGPRRAGANSNVGEAEWCSPPRCRGRGETTGGDRKMGLGPARRA